MSDVTQRFGIEEPSANRSDAADVPYFIRKVVAALEGQGTRYGQGPLGSRPSAGKQGTLYFATDQTPIQVFYDTGIAWVQIGSLASGSIGTGQLADGAVTTPKIADAAVTAAKVLDASLPGSKLIDGAVDGPKIATGLKPSQGAPATTEALRALGVATGQAAPGRHATQHGETGTDPLTITSGMLDPAVLALLPQPGDEKQVAYDVVAGVNEPVGWLLEDGREFANTTYPALAAKLGNQHGGTPGSTFKIPDSRGRTAVGKGTGSGLTARAVGQTFGEENHVSTINEMPVHNHGGGTGNSSAFNTGVNSPLGDLVTSIASFNEYPPTNPAGGSMITGLTANTHVHSVPAHSHSISNQGGGAAHNNMQPSRVVSVLIKT